MGSQKKLPFQMPVVNERHRVSTSQNEAQFIGRNMKNCKSSRKSETFSPDSIWSIPDMFSCLEYLGANMAKDLAPYDRISYSGSSFDKVCHF